MQPIAATPVLGTQAFRNALRAEYDKAILELALSRLMLTNGFYRQNGNAVFEAHYRALLAGQDHSQDATTAPLQVLSAAMGTGKTSFSTAFIAALVRLGETQPDIPRGVLVLVPMKTDVERWFRELNALIPGKVAAWSQDHDAEAPPSRSGKASVPDPARRFWFDELVDYPVAIVTTNLFAGKRGHRVRNLRLGDGNAARALTVVDEQPSQVQAHDVTLAQASVVLEAIELLPNERGALAITPMRELIRFMADHACTDGRPPIETTWQNTPNAVRWFTTPRGIRFADSHRAIPSLPDVFGFARALAKSYAFISRYSGGVGTRFVGYEVAFELPPGTVLLDASADVDGINQLCPWRVPVETPPVRYDRLQIVHMTPLTSQRNLSQFLENESHRHAYVEWLKNTIIKPNMQPGERGLVVCKKVLLETAFASLTGAALDEDHAAYTTGFAWDLEGRKLCVSHWGTGVGSNAWADADVVFLIGEPYMPRRGAIAHTQGYLRAKVSEGPLRAMSAHNARSPAVDTIAEGHVNRQIKQMALRGRGRSFDEHGVCGHQRVVFAGDYKRLQLHLHRLFPGAALPARDPNDCSGSLADRLTELLSADDVLEITTATISAKLNTQWRSCSKRLLNDPAVMLSMDRGGWHYEPSRGRKGSRFARDACVVPLAA